MTAGEMRRLLDGVPDDMYIFMYVDDTNCLQVCETNSNIEEIMTDMDQCIRVFMLRPMESKDLLIPTSIIDNLQ
jgi:hypothetical protein